VRSLVRGKGRTATAWGRRAGEEQEKSRRRAGEEQECSDSIPRSDARRDAWE
jgi:hypothetical protein